ncbi:hypothetical protein MD484_g2850, partial [Candolleomyces efflorescens]
MASTVFQHGLPRPVPTTSSYEELFPPTYRFDELPPLWPAVKGGYKTPIYILGWLVRVRNARIRFGGYHTPWNCNVALARWNELGFDNEENKRDGVCEPDVMVYGEHHFLFAIADNQLVGLRAMKRPEVRERALQEALQVLEFDPKRATVEKIRWFRLPAPRNVLKKPVSFPHIYCEKKHVLPQLIREMMDGSWKKRYPPQFAPGFLKYLEWEREYDARKQKVIAQQQKIAQKEEKSGLSDSSESTTVGPSSS